MTHNETDEVKACAGCMVMRAFPAYLVESQTPWSVLPADRCQCTDPKCVIAKGEVYVSQVLAKAPMKRRMMVEVQYHPRLGG